MNSKLEKLVEWGRTTKEDLKEISPNMLAAGFYGGITGIGLVGTAVLLGARGDPFYSVDSTLASVTGPILSLCGAEKAYTVIKSGYQKLKEKVYE